MSAVTDILNQLPIDQLAAQVGEDPQTTQAVASDVVATLLHGMSANAADPAGEQSLASALTDHADQPLDIEAVDPADGDKIVRHIFGAQTPDVIATLGDASPQGNSDLVRKLLPILAPIVLAYLGKKLAAGNSPYGDILGQILSQALGGQQAPAPAPQAPAQPAEPAEPAPQAPAQQPSASSLGADVLGELLKGMLGQGRR